MLLYPMVVRRGMLSTRVSLARLSTGDTRIVDGDGSNASTSTPLKGVSSRWRRRGSLGGGERGTCLSANDKLIDGCLLL